MLYELLTFIYFLSLGVILYFPLNFLIFFMIRQVSLRLFARRYKPYEAKVDRSKIKVSVVIPEYNEDLDIFEKCVKSAYLNKPDEIIIVHDDGRKEVAEIGRKYGAKVISLKKRSGKKAALIMGWLNATGDIIVQLDSDTIMKEGALEEIIKPFLVDPNIAGVQGRPVLFKTGSHFSYLIGQIVEYSRDIVSRALNGHLWVIDGKIAAYRRSYVLEAVRYFNNEYFMGNKLTIADDKALTYYANKVGYKTVYQSTAVGFSAAQPTFIAFLKQQLRWMRSGYLYLLIELKTRTFFSAPIRYKFHVLTYLFSPFSFLLALIDSFISPANPTQWSWGYLAYYGFNIPIVLYALLIFLVGLYINLKLGFKLMGLKLPDKISFIDGVTVGLLGLFVIFPTFLYAGLTFIKLPKSEWRGGSLAG